ncbi:hypothetical protein RCG17_01585 [Neobacillus sp. PS3-12]|nr:hypothetical protein [Neobacillus sp. PS3-12]WML53423.1 hypothetical protein RCG17_01585 [Neobacillus sp. PS3-12]
MNSQFQTLFQSGNRNIPRIWLDSIAYANRLFAGESRSFGGILHP